MTTLRALVAISAAFMAAPLLMLLAIQQAGAKGRQELRSARAGFSGASVDFARARAAASRRENHP